MDLIQLLVVVVVIGLVFWLVRHPWTPELAERCTDEIVSRYWCQHDCEPPSFVLKVDAAGIMNLEEL